MGKSRRQLDQGRAGGAESHDVYDADTNQLLVNGKADINSFSPTPKTGPGMIDIVRLAGPGLKHDIQRALNVRNLSAETALTQEQSDYSLIRGPTSRDRGCGTWTSRASTR